MATVVNEQYVCSCCANKVANDETCDHESHNENLAEFGLEANENAVISSPGGSVIAFRCFGCGEDVFDYDTVVAILAD